MEDQKCFLCPKEAQVNYDPGTNSYVVDCKSCGVYRVSWMANKVYFSNNKLDAVALEKLRTHVGGVALLTPELIWSITGVPSVHTS